MNNETVSNFISDVMLGLLAGLSAYLWASENYFLAGSISFITIAGFARSIIKQIFE